MEVDHLRTIAVFARVARLRSFTAAADELGLSTATVSRQIAQLERKVGMQLFVRTTRHVSLTEIGETFFQRSSALLALAEESLEEINDLHAEPRGTLRVTAPRLFSVKHLGALISDFSERYPKVQVRLTVSDELENISGGDYDVAVRITNHLDDGVVAKRLAAINWIICASPEYIQKSGIPHTPEDLAAHECHFYASLIKNNRWTFTKDGHEYSTPVRSQFRVNSSQVIADHVLAGRGIAMLPTYLIGEYLQSGRLVPVLTAYRPTINSSLYAIYSPTRFLTTKVRSFLDLLAQAFSDPPYWEGPDVGRRPAPG